MDEEVWSGLEQLQLPLANDVAGLHPAAVDDALHAPFCWSALTASFLAGDDVDIAGSAGDSNKVTAAEDMDMVLDLQGTGCFGTADEQHDLLMMRHQPELNYSSSSLSSPKRSLSMDSAGTTSSPAFSFGLDDGAAAAATFSGSAVPHDPFAADDDAVLMRAMMAVLSSASPSSSESSSPPRRCHHEGGGGSSIVQQAAAAAVLYQSGGGGNVTVRSTSLAVAPEKNTALHTTSSAGGGVGRQQHQDDATRAAAGSSSQSQVYHMMSERKRREKLNDSFQTLRSLLPPCSKKDKTTVLINAASYLKKLEAEVSELEEKNAKLERHVPREDGGAAHAQAAAHRRAKVQVSRAPSDAADQVNLTVMVMVECDIVDLVLHVLERLRWMAGVTVLSVDADTYSPQVLLKAIASIKLQITDGDCWNEASFHEAMKKVVHDATSSPACSAPLVVAA